MVKIKPNKRNRLKKTSAADCFQVRSISEQRFANKMGTTDIDTFDEIKDGLAKVLSIGY